MTRLAIPNNDHAHPTPTPPKKIDQFLIFVNLYQHAKKNSHSNLFILQSPVTRLATPNFDYANLKDFQPPIYLHEFVPACKKSVSSICSFFRYSQF